MKINDIKPYKKNPRNNASAIEPVAKSIKEFGLRGQIVLESRENPTIVCGHTRWQACKYLGWREIPDSKIDFADGLTAEQIQAYRLADNRTAEFATWNKKLLQDEAKTIIKTGYDFDFRGYGFSFGERDNERLRTDKKYNLDIISKDWKLTQWGIPIVTDCGVLPSRLLSFNQAKTAISKDCGIHFFIDDYQFERIWEQPKKYTELLASFECVLMPDFSLYLNMPKAQQLYNVYRSHVISRYWQCNGVNVIPVLTWSDKQSYSFCFDGIAQGSICATSSVGVKRNKKSMQIWQCGMTAALQIVQPKAILLYGSMPDFNFGETKVITYKTFTEVNHGR